MIEITALPQLDIDELGQPITERMPLIDLRVSPDERFSVWGKLTFEIKNSSSKFYAGMSNSSIAYYLLYALVQHACFHASYLTQMIYFSLGPFAFIFLYLIFFKNQQYSLFMMTSNVLQVLTMIVFFIRFKFLALFAALLLIVEMTAFQVDFEVGKVNFLMRSKLLLAICYFLFGLRLFFDKIPEILLLSIFLALSSVVYFLAPLMVFYWTFELLKMISFERSKSEPVISNFEKKNERFVAFEVLEASFWGFNFYLLLVSSLTRAFKATFRPELSVFFLFGYMVWAFHACVFAYLSIRPRYIARGPYCLRRGLLNNPFFVQNLEKIRAFSESRCLLCGARALEIVRDCEHCDLCFVCWRDPLNAKRRKICFVCKQRNGLARQFSIVNNLVSVLGTFNLS